MSAVPAIALKSSRDLGRMHQAKSGASRQLRKGDRKVNLKLLKPNKTSGLLTAREQEQVILENRLKARTLAHSILRRWRARLDPQEVESIVDLSLCEAVRRFNKHKGAAFMTFLYYHLRGNLIRAVSIAASYTSLPFADLEGGEGGSDGLLGQHHANALEVAQTLCNHDFISPDEVVLKKEIAQLSLAACAELDALEREVIYRIYVQEEQLMDIAASLGYSRCHISRVKKKALETLFDDLAGPLEVDPATRDRVGEEDNTPRKPVLRRRPRAGVSTRSEEAATEYFVAAAR
jgi:RNA polymerase sigma factor (sigma-70 family)